MTPFEQELFTQWIKGVHLPASLTTLNHTIMTQYTLSKGLQVFGPLGKEAVFHEMQQLHQRKVCEPRKATDLFANQRKASLGYLMFLKQKRSGQIKGRGVLMVGNNTYTLVKREKHLPLSPQNLSCSPVPLMAKKDGTWRLWTSLEPSCTQTRTRQFTCGYKAPLLIYW